MGFLGLKRPATGNRMLALTVFGVIAASVYWGVNASYREDRFQAVDITGIHHLGSAFNIDRFYVDGYDASNVGRGGGGGSNVCCVLLPKKWRPNLTIDLRWSVGDWSEENAAETEQGNYRSLSSAGVYRARVAVEKYEHAEHLFVHFFPNGKARVVSSLVGRGNPKHPIQEDDPHAADTATAGTSVDELFTPAERAENLRRAASDRKQHGDWR